MDFVDDFFDLVFALPNDPKKNNPTQWPKNQPLKKVHEVQFVLPKLKMIECSPYVLPRRCFFNSFRHTGFTESYESLRNRNQIYQNR